eukprot:RCo047116
MSSPEQHMSASSQGEGLAEFSNPLSGPAPAGHQFRRLRSSLSSGRFVEAAHLGPASCCMGFRVPIWLLMVLLAVVSAAAVGVLTFCLMYFRSVSAINEVGVSYRGVYCTVVQNEVVAFFTRIMGATRQTLNFAFLAGVGPGSLYPIEFRKYLFSASGVTSEANSLVIGLASGEFFGLDRVPTTGELHWGLSNAQTGYLFSTFPAPGWGEDEWFREFGNITTVPGHYNTTVRSWYLTASAAPEVAFAPVYYALFPYLPSGGALALTVVKAGRDSAGRVLFVSSSVCTLQHFDDFLKATVSALVAGSVAFLVEAKSGYLLASSVPGQQLVEQSFTVTGSAVRVAAVNANSAEISAISLRVAGAAAEWLRFCNTTS